jgi:inositol polyphosphate 5-phosphatase INPP5B/F
MRNCHENFFVLTILIVRHRGAPGKFKATTLDSGRIQPGQISNEFEDESVRFEMADAGSSVDPPSEDFQFISVSESTPHLLSCALFERRAEYTMSHTMKIKIGSWNVAACPNIEEGILDWFVKGKGVDEDLRSCDISRHINGQDKERVETAAAQENKMTSNGPTLLLNDHGASSGDEKIGLYILGLQEFVELTSAKEYLTRVYVDPSPINTWKSAVTKALPEGYQLIADPHLSGLLLLIYASPEIAPTISSVSSIEIGTGFWGYLGNKGAVVTRIVLGETTKLVFVNCHLSSGTEAGSIERRCWDVAHIIGKTQFEPISRSGVAEDMKEGIGEEDFAFWFGDLNFRLDGIPGDDIRRLLMLHAKGEYGRSSKTPEQIEESLGNDSPIFLYHVDSDDESLEPSTPQMKIPAFRGRCTSSLPNPDKFIHGQNSDPTSLQATLDSLLTHDQLRHVQKSRKAFHDGWREGTITFLPTYKYDIGSVNVFDSSEKRRAPSWCDRILFRTRQDKLEYDAKSKEEALAKLKDEEMKARGLDKAAEEDNVLYNYDPETDGEDLDGDRSHDENEDIQYNPEKVVTKEGYVDRIHLDMYSSYRRVLSSDHKPVVALFTLQYDAVVPELKSKIHNEVARELDRAENEGRPVITVVSDSPQEAVDGLPDPDSTPTSGRLEVIDFGEVRYLQRKSRGLTVANTGQVPAQLEFLKRPVGACETELISPEWLSIYFVSPDIDEKSMSSEITLEPGDTLNITLQVYVENITLVKALNEEETQLDDILVLRVTDGRDHFLPLRGTWLQSCFGRSIDELIRIPEGGVRAILPRHNGSGGHINRERPVYWSAPHELFKLTEAVELLATHVAVGKDMVANMALPIKNIGWPFDEDSWTYVHAKDRENHRGCLLEALDADKNLVNCFPLEVSTAEKLEIMSEVLLKFLGGLDDGLIPAPLWQILERDMATRRQPMQPEEARNWVLDVLSTSPNHNISLVFVTSMLSKVAQELGPTQQPRSTSSASSTTRSLNRHGALVVRGGTAATNQDPATARQAMVHRWAAVFADVIFRISTPTREKERRAAEERRRGIVEAFLHDKPS